jgi:ECF sigma factor
MTEVTQILNAIEAGDPWAAAQLLPLVYDELRRLASARMAIEKPGQTLGGTVNVLNPNKSLFQKPLSPVLGGEGLG